MQDILDLNFEKQNTLYATHSIHAYAAKCPPQLVKYSIENFSKLGETVLDPMVGSGTSMVEARLNGRNGIAYDIDPLACLISKVKSSIIKNESINEAFDLIFSKTKEDLIILEMGLAPKEILARSQAPLFPNNTYWFRDQVAQTLAILSYHIKNAPMSDQVRDFFWVALSSLILAKNSVANARDITHSRHHYYEHKELPNTLERFVNRVQRMRVQMTNFRQMCENLPDSQIKITQGDARNIPVADEAIDLIFTSPPYATALDYSRAHFLAIPWLEKALNTSFENYRLEAPKYIGSERGKLPKSFEIEHCLSQLDLTASVLSNLALVSNRHAKLIHRYFLDMHSVFREMARVLKTGHYAVIVVCPSNIRKIDVPTHRIFVEMGQKIGLELFAEHTRTIGNHRRLLPYMKESFGNRMSTEYVQIFRKT